jgi:hypothetical protein
MKLEKIIHYFNKKIISWNQNTSLLPVHDGACLEFNFVWVASMLSHSTHSTDCRKGKEDGRPSCFLGWPCSRPQGKLQISLFIMVALKGACNKIKGFCNAGLKFLFIHDTIMKKVSFWWLHLSLCGQRYMYLTNKRLKNGGRNPVFTFWCDHGKPAHVPWININILNQLHLLSPIKITSFDTWYCTPKLERLDNVMGCIGFCSWPDRLLFPHVTWSVQTCPYLAMR